MGSNSKGITASFPLAEREAIEARVRELNLPERGGLSTYFQMLRDYDRRFKLVPHYHQKDRTLRFYPEEEAQGWLAAEDAAPYPDVTGAAAAALRKAEADAEARRKAQTPSSSAE